MYRTVQNHPIKNCFTSYTKQILVQLKETDEQNKNLRTSLREILTEISEIKNNKQKI